MKAADAYELLTELHGAVGIMAAAASIATKGEPKPALRTIPAGHADMVSELVESEWGQKYLGAVAVRIEPHGSSDKLRTIRVKYEGRPGRMKGEG